MTIFALGINHRTASLNIRDKAAFGPEEIPDALNSLLNQNGLEEAVILSTCNRTEIYGFGESTDILDWLAHSRGIAAAELRTCSYQHKEEDGIRHLMKVACGLDSMVLGEPQILGQLKSAYSVAHQSGALSNQLNQAFQMTFAVAKRVRTETAIGHNPVSVAYAAVKLSQQIFAELNPLTALLIGAGETIDLVARHLRDKNIGRIIVANRTLARAEELADKFNAEAILLADIPEQLHRADIVISSTASLLPVLGKGAVESALKARKHKPMFMVDIAVPRDIEPEVGDIDDVYLFTVDDLQQVVEDNRRSREKEADSAQQIVEESVDSWRKQSRALEVVDTIRTYRQQVEQIRDQELERALQMLSSGQSPEYALSQMARSLTNKFLHTPTVTLKKAAEEGNTEHIAAASKILGVENNNSSK
ncbi:MAG: glutamyl-tRNA reductase [bacterium]